MAFVVARSYACRRPINDCKKRLRKSNSFLESKIFMPEGNTTNFYRTSYFKNATYAPAKKTRLNNSKIPRSNKAAPKTSRSGIG